MTKKHFIALADALRRTKPHISTTREYGQWSLMVGELADFCQSQNAQFNRSRWLAYIAGKCGPNGGAR